MHARTRIVIIVLTLAVVGGCASMPTTQDDRTIIEREARGTVERFRAVDPTLEEFFETCAGYAVFSRVAKGGIGVGGAHGTGVVFEKGVPIGYCEMTQGTIGFQIGGQAYAEIIFFERASALDKFRSGTFEFAGRASAVAAQSGAGADAPYANGVAVFTLSTGGLMAEASIGGQQFDYEPR